MDAVAGKGIGMWSRRQTQKCPTWVGVKYSATAPLVVPSTADSGVGWGGADVVVDDAVEGGGGDDASLSCCDTGSAIIADGVVGVVVSGDVGRYFAKKAAMASSDTGVPVDRRIVVVPSVLIPRGTAVGLTSVHVTDKVVVDVECRSPNRTKTGGTVVEIRRLLTVGNRVVFVDANLTNPVFRFVVSVLIRVVRLAVGIRVVAVTAVETAGDMAHSNAAIKIADM